MNMYERARNQIISELSKNTKSESIESILRCVDRVMVDYEVVAKETALVPYADPIPPEVGYYLNCLKLTASHGTVINYKYCIDNFFLRVGKRPAEVSTNDIRAYINEYQAMRGISDASLDKIRMMINSFYNWAILEGYVDRNPCAIIKKLKYEQKQRHALSTIETEQLRLAAVPKRKTPCKRDLRYEAVTELLYSTGCRVAEIANAKRTDLNGNVLTVVGKGKKQRKVYLNAKAQICLNNYLKARKDDCEYLIPSANKPYHKSSEPSLRRAVRCVANRAGLETNVTPHVIRHTTATAMLQRGGNITSISKMLGHSSVNTTMMYAEVADLDVAREHEKYVV